MKDNRKANRWHPVENFSSDFFCNGVKDKVEVLDVSALGMRAFFSNPVTVGMETSGELDIPHNTIPFFVKGKIIRVRESSNRWETAVQFFKISTTKAPH
ncbi:MAG: hypothetical protein A2219_01085 [Elusimicrobia bacterium RIFOXYA2_FULL_50_26]|nr:MAG: hypothetical protein A2219_01085 [Elusimicrobia bacterium RIFOXYA2_FULL_50_26]OGS23407.1 MAG: hypothetical protein A2314_00615 [Elusimicrobia bacterium RIFOXYB2_FULL_50_12]